MKTIGFSTYEKMPDGTADDQLAAVELRRLGFEVTPVVWDDPSVNARGLDAVVMRSCWDYHLKPERFAEWVESLDRAGVRVLNSSRVTRWNLDKRYLEDLASRGVAIPRTVWLERRLERRLEQGSRVDLAALLREHEIQEAVIKPVISASAYRTWRMSAAEADQYQGALDEVLADRDVMVQEFIEEVTAQGEISFVFLGGEHSHTVLKRPKAGDFRVQEDYGGSREIWSPAPSLVEQARAAVDRVGEPVVFARVDGIDVGGRLVLMELELIDPVLFLGLDEQAPRRFAEAIARSL